MNSLKKRFYSAVALILSLHALLLLALFLFRVSEFIALHSMISDAGTPALPAFVRGLWFDNVIACYITVLPLTLTLILALFGPVKVWAQRFVCTWYTLWGILSLFISAANIPYYRYFGKNINSSIFEWFGYAKTTTGMLLQESSYWFYLGLFGVVACWYGWQNEKLRHTFASGLQKRVYGKAGLASLLSNVLITLLLVGACIFGIRGRVGYNPIKISQAYYCNDSFLNQLGINPAFNLLTSTLDDMRAENKELHLMPYPEAISQARLSLGIQAPLDSADVLERYIAAPEGTTQRKPNIVIILMESMSAHLMSTFGQQQHLTPTLDSLSQHSLFFKNFYSAGIHTNHGMTASLYSFPALMFRNLMKGTVTPHRRGLPTVLKEVGYRNMFFMTHEAQYDNMKAFFSTNGYDDIYSQENYPSSEVVNNFGVSDHYVLEYALRAIDQKSKSHQPFFATILTISNHPPYVIPDYFHPHTQEKESQIVEYADWAIGNFLQKARQKSWYNNTVFVLLADHGKLVGENEGELATSYNHIPLFIFGPGIPQQTMNGLGMQVDLMPTLLGLLGQSYRYDGFGQDLMHQPRQYVFYSADDQLVARDSTRCFIYNPKMKRSFCYHVKKDGTLIPHEQQDAFRDLKHYVFSMIQTAEYIERHRQ